MKTTTTTSAAKNTKSSKPKMTIETSAPETKVDFKSDMMRPFKLWVCAKGTVQIQDPGSRPPAGMLPVFSTNTRDEAESLRVRHCRSARDGSGIYTLNNPPKSVEDLSAVTELFRATYASRKS